MRFYKLTSITTNNSTSFLSLTTGADKSVNAQSVNPSGNEAFVSAKDGVDQFSSSISNTANAISDIDSAINDTQDEAKKQELMNQKEVLGSQKKELEGKQEVLKGKMNQIKSEMEAHRSTSSRIRSELSRLNANKSSIEKTMQFENKELVSKNASLKTVSSKIEATRAELDGAIESLNATVADMTKKSEDDLKQQRKAISAATTEALLMVQSGEITSEEMPSYIAGKINGFDSVGSTSAGTIIVDSSNTKIKGLCSQLSSYVDHQGAIQLSVKASSNKVKSVSPIYEALNAQVQAKSSELATSDGLMDSKQAELGSVSAEFAGNGSQISSLGSQIAEIVTQFFAALAPTPEAKEVKAHREQTRERPQLNQFFVSNNKSNAFETDINFDSQMNEINSKYDKTLTEEVKNTEVEKLKSKMAESDRLITTLRNHLSDNAQKIIEERLAATKRK